MPLRLGIDIGRLYTRAVILDETPAVRYSFEVATDGNPVQSMARVCSYLGSKIQSPEVVNHVSVGSYELGRLEEFAGTLSSVAVIRIGPPSMSSLAPMLGWPPWINVPESSLLIAAGGHTYDGQKLQSLDTEAIRQFVAREAARTDAFAVSAVFSPVAPSHELQCQEIIQEVAGLTATVSLSHHIGSLGFLERENAALLNSSLVRECTQRIQRYELVLQNAGIKAPLFFMKGDGSVMSSRYAREWPIGLMGEEAACAIRGALYISKHKDDAIVVSLGDERIYVGSVANGMFREKTHTQISGIDTGLRSPDVIELPGGRDILASTDAQGRILSPFEGSATVQEEMQAPLAIDCSEPGNQTLDTWSLLVEAIDQQKDRSRLVTVVAAGESRVYIPDDLPGVDRVLHLGNGEFVSAVGVGAAEVIGRSDRIYTVAGGTPGGLLQSARRVAEMNAMIAGANPEQLHLIEEESVPLAYLPQQAIRVTVLVAGPPDSPGVGFNQ